MHEYAPRIAAAGAAPGVRAAGRLDRAVGSGRSGAQTFRSWSLCWRISSSIPMRRFAAAALRAPAAYRQYWHVELSIDLAAASPAAVRRLVPTRPTRSSPRSTISKPRQLDDFIEASGATVSACGSSATARRIIPCCACARRAGAVSTRPINRRKPAALRSCSSSCRPTSRRHGDRSGLPHSRTRARAAASIWSASSATSSSPAPPRCVRA